MAEYLIRHGESTTNLQRVFAGRRLDVELTDKGREQARQAVEKLKPLNITKIIVSPLKRAIATAEIISKELGVPFTIDERLAEHDMGSLSGTPIRDVTPEELATATDFETPQHYAERIFASMFEHAHDSGNTLFVAHGGTAKMIQGVLTDVPMDKIFHMPLAGNSEIIEIDTEALKAKLNQSR